MIKSNLKTIVATLFAATLTGCMGCGGNSHENEAPLLGDTVTVRPDFMRDHTTYGFCYGMRGTKMTMLTDSGDTIYVDLAEATEENQVFGNPSTGDRVAVMLTRDKLRATLVVNESVLLGDWVMDDPLSGQGKVGVRFKDGGIAESINQESYIYNSWRFWDGKLVISMTREGGAEIEEIDSFRIKYLSKDSLCYCNKIDTMFYSRPKPPEY